jgi:hypothetical protein
MNCVLCKNEMPESKVKVCSACVESGAVERELAKFDRLPNSYAMNALGEIPDSKKKDLELRPVELGTALEISGDDEARSSNNIKTFRKRPCVDFVKGYRRD